jgi:hypothetical protein
MTDIAADTISFLLLWIMASAIFTIGWVLLHVWADR